MAEDKPAESPLITAIRSLGRQVADEFRTTARNVLMSLVATAATVVLILTAAAVSVCIGVSFLALGLHTVILSLIGSPWFADLLTGIIMTGLPLVAIVLTRRQVASHPRPVPAPTPSTTP